IQEKMINTVTLLQVLQVSRLRTKEHGIYEYIINFIDKVKTSNIQTPPTCQCQNSVNNLNNGWCESCGIGMVPGVILPLWTSGNSEINKIIFNTQLESKHMFDHIEWINHDGFRNIKEIKKGRFGCIYSSIWIDGPMPLFGMARNGAQNVIIKSLGRTPSDVTPEFIRELADSEMNDKEFGRNPRVLEDEDVYYSQFIDLDAISKEEPFEVLDEVDRKKK
ncbi:18390_t:CDS:2, partial [Gigaspora rosea]